MRYAFFALYSIILTITYYDNVLFEKIIENLLKVDLRLFSKMVISALIFMRVKFNSSNKTPQKSLIVHCAS